MRFAVDEVITFEDEPDSPYTVQAIGSRFAVLTRSRSPGQCNDTEK